MPLREDVGGRPRQGQGPEEVHRLAASQGQPSGNQQTPTPIPIWGRLLGHRRFRLQAAGVVALGLIVFLTFAFFPTRKVRIAVDGDVTTVNSRAASDVAVVEEAGIELQPGDKVEAREDVLAVRRATEAILEVDGETFAVRTQSETIEELLFEAEISLEPQDSVLQNQLFVAADAPLTAPPALASLLQGGAVEDSRPPGEPVVLEVRRAVPFTVVESQQRLQVRSSRETVATALRDVGVRLGPGDVVQPPLDTELTAGLEVHVEHAVPVVVTLPGGKLILYSLAPTVGEALADGGVELPPTYRLEPPPETPMAAGMVIHVVGVSEEQELEQERIESRTVYQPDPALAWGESRVSRGQDGVHYRQYRVVYENGQVISRELIAEWYDPEPVDTVIYYSPATAPPTPLPTAMPVQLAPGDVPDGLDVLRVMRVYATWYNPASCGRPPSDPSYGITATGVPVDRGVVAVDPSVIPLGTRMYIPGYGYGVAADTGGGIRGNMIDLGYPDGVVPDWTTRWVDIYILRP